MPTDEQIEAACEAYARAAGRPWDDKHLARDAMRDFMRAALAAADADARRLSGGLIAISDAPEGTPASVLRSIAYDVALNCMDIEAATFQIVRRTEALRAALHAEAAVALEDAEGERGT